MDKLAHLNELKKNESNVVVAAATRAFIVQAAGELELAKITFENTERRLNSDLLNLKYILESVQANDGSKESIE